MIAKARDLNLVRLMADEYVHFVCHINPHFSEADSCSLLEAVVEYYAVHIDSLVEMFAFDRRNENSVIPELCSLPECHQLCLS